MKHMQHNSGDQVGVMHMQPRGTSSTACCLARLIWGACRPAAASEGGGVVKDTWQIATAVYLSLRRAVVGGEGVCVEHIILEGHKQPADTSSKNQRHSSDAEALNVRRPAAGEVQRGGRRHSSNVWMKPPLPHAWQKM